jgi:hypothetical protein
MDKMKTFSKCIEESIEAHGYEGTVFDMINMLGAYQLLGVFEHAAEIYAEAKVNEFVDGIPPIMKDNLDIKS